MRLREWARSVKRDAVALYFAARDARTPWYAKALGIAVAGYALSPIDLIPDFIPVIGYLDDVILVPVGIWIVVRLVPADVMAACRARAQEVSNRPVSRTAAAAIVGIWAAAFLAAAWFCFPLATSWWEGARQADG